MIGLSGRLRFFGPPPATHRRLAGLAWSALPRLLARPLAVVAMLGAALTHARAALAKDRAVAIYAEGADASAVAHALSTAIPSGVQAVDPDAFRAALVKRGQRGPFGKQLDRGNRGAALSRLRKAEADIGADMALVARVTKEKKRRRVLLLLVDATGAATDLDTLVLGRVEAAGDDAKLVSAVGTALDKYKNEPEDQRATSDGKSGAPTDATPSEAPIATPPPAETADTAQDRGPSEERPRGSVARSLFVAEVDAEAAGRNFQYNQPITPNLRSYNMFPAPTLRAAAELFPLADIRFGGASGVLRDVGILGEYSRALFLKSSAKGGAGLDTDDTAYMVGVRVRVHPGGESGPVFGISDAYAVELLTFGATGTVIDGQVPSARYSANRIAVDARLPFGKLAGLLSVGYRSVLEAGPVAQRFRGSSVNGIDAQLGGALTLVPGWELRLVAHYERYFYAFKPRPGDPFVAGGALDQFFAARVGVAYIY